jgi:hypothetical protein
LTQQEILLQVGTEKSMVEDIGLNPSGQYDLVAGNIQIEI